MTGVKLWASLLMMGFAMTTQAQEKVRDLGKVVVTGNKFETPIEKSDHGR